MEEFEKALTPETWDIVIAQLEEAGKRINKLTEKCKAKEMTIKVNGEKFIIRSEEELFGWYEAGYYDYAKLDKFRERWYRLNEKLFNEKHNLILAHTMIGVYLNNAKVWRKDA